MCPWVLKRETLYELSSPRGPQLRFLNRRDPARDKRSSAAWHGWSCRDASGENQPWSELGRRVEGGDRLQQSLFESAELTGREVS